MSLFATVSFALSFGKFRNIDLLQSGFYRLRSRLYFLNDGVAYSAIPRNIIYSKQQKLDLKCEGILEDGSILSRPFQINYVDDVADLNETFIFTSDVKLHVPSTKPFSSFFSDSSQTDSNEIFRSKFSNSQLFIAPFFLEVDLLYSENSDLMLPHDPASISEELNGENMEHLQPSKEEFSSLCYNVYRINNVANGIVEYLPIIFDEFHFCNTSCLILSQITRIFACFDSHYSENKTQYIPRFFSTKPLPVIPSFLLSTDKNEENSELSDKDFSKNLNKSFKHDENKNTYTVNIKCRAQVGSFTIRGILIQKMAQTFTESLKELPDQDHVKNSSDLKLDQNIEAPAKEKETNELSELSDNNELNDNQEITTEYEDIQCNKEKGEPTDQKAIIGIDEVFPSIVTRDPMFIEASKLRLELIASLTNIYLQLAANMHFITKKCCSAQRAKLMGSFLVIPSLELPGGSRLNVEPLVDLSEVIYEENGASIPFCVVREQIDQTDEHKTSRISSEIQLQEANEFKHSLTIASDGSSIGVLPEQRLSDSALCLVKLPTTIWALTPLNWQLNYIRGVTPPIFKRTPTSHIITPDLLISHEPILPFQNVIEAPFGIAQYSRKINLELEKISFQIFETWNRLVSILPFVLHNLEQTCKMEHIRKTMFLWNETIFFETLSINELYSPSLKPEPSLKFPEFLGNRSFPITPPVMLSVNSSPPPNHLPNNGQINKKNSGFFSIFPILTGGSGLNSQNSTIFVLKPIDYYSRVADLLRNDMVFKSIPTPNAIEEVCLPPLHEITSNSDSQSNTKNETFDENTLNTISTEHLKSSKYNEWLPILFIQRYSNPLTSNNCCKPQTQSIKTNSTVINTIIDNSKALINHGGGIITHCGQLCRVGINNDPAINAKNIVSRKIEQESNRTPNSPCLNNGQKTEKETNKDEEAPKIPIIKTEVPFLESSKESTKDLHIMIFVHGLQGSAFDMRNVRNIISLYYPDVLCLLSTCNEDYTDGPIEEMGKRLSDEVIAAISPFSKSLKKLSFVGHSLGGIIIRAALPHLYMFSSQFYLYWSLSTPHLGCISNDSKLINAGVWIMKKWSSSQCINQLALSDASNYEETFMYKLATEHSELFSKFKHIVFCSSHQDMYAPYDSARAEYSPDGPAVYKVMVESLLKDVDPTRIVKVDVNFHLPQKNLDTFIGRAAHIQVIENHFFVKILVSRFPEWFIV
ncbi:ZW18 protein [Cryptosporidium sp. chipmunk genotype I]|uniref:ZW18 protein n=1 Tax=Cryptosporidium sp. chipmunk genotype I TaxID=1280935 RepID=UPI00351A05BB|nr:ZW18 protein [Cryptosporidium sp. chipmunk genotype I]